MADRYVLITAAHNEEAFIDKTCESVVAQHMQPVKWIVVDDASHDRTAQIVDRYRRTHPDLIELVQVRREPGRHFGHKVNAFNIGLARARSIGFDFIGNLDADISLESDYYESMLARFRDDLSIGIAGGMVSSCIDGRFVSQDVAPDSVAGAIQLFRRSCFEAVGGYLPLRYGGIDAAAEILARQKGFTVRTFADKRVLEHRRTGSATANPLRARRREGVRLYSLGYALSFFAARCARRSLERPRFIGSAVALFGFVCSALRRDPIVLPADAVRNLRREQRHKLLRAMALASFGRSD